MEPSCVIQDRSTVLHSQGCSKVGPGSSLLSAGSLALQAGLGVRHCLDLRETGLRWVGMDHEGM